MDFGLLIAELFIGLAVLIALPLGLHLGNITWRKRLPLHSTKRLIATILLVCGTIVFVLALIYLVFVLALIFLVLPHEHGNWLNIN
jgi:uncharacterized iron-regulated membrane protein